MLDLDFAFFDMRNSNRQGLANRKVFLDRLAPVLFSPRVERLIDFSRWGLKGCNVRLPLGEGNWSILHPDKRSWMMEKTESIMREYEISRISVDRRLRGLFMSQQHHLPLVYGDHFITALAAILMDRVLERQEVNKLILVGDIPDICSLINNISRYRIPISVQNYHPARYEIMIHRLLYEEGLAVSNSCINPYNWGRGDLVVSVEPDSRSLALASPEAFYIRLDDNSNGLAPELEEILGSAGMNGCLHTLAPILESCLLEQAGNIIHDGEDSYSDREEKANEIHHRLIEAGESTGLWEPFLM